MNNPGTAPGKASRYKNNPNHHELVQPFLKWAGGKRQLLPTIRKYVPAKYLRYFEPFVGAGAVLFDLQPKQALINDANEELINCYRIIKDHPDELIEHARSHELTKQYYYRLRSRDRDPDFQTLSAVERASRVIFLNKTCYNGLFRVNSRGQFNVPFGRYSDPTILHEDVIKAISRYFNQADIEFSTGDFATALSGAARGDFAYLDPPYDPISDTSSFTGYSLQGFGREEQHRLKETCDELDARGCKLLLSNSATDFIRNLYSDANRYTIVEVDASRNINSDRYARGKVNELLIFNTGPSR